MEKQKLWTDDPNEDLRQSGHGAKVMWDVAARTVFKSVAAIVDLPPRSPGPAHIPPRSKCPFG